MPTSTTYYAWTDSYNSTLYTTSSTPSVGDATYYYSGGVMSDQALPITNIDSGWIAIMNEYSLSNRYNRSSSSDVTITSSGSIDANTLYNITDDTDVSLTILEALYPVGSIYITTANTCPLSTLISGSTWTLVSSGIVKAGDIPCKGNGMTLGLTNGTVNGGLSTTSAGDLNLRAAQTVYGANISSNDGATAAKGNYGVTLDETKSGIVADTSSLTLSVNIFERTA